MEGYQEIGNKMTSIITFHWRSIYIKHQIDKISSTNNLGVWYFAKKDIMSQKEDQEAGNQLIPIK